jgi:competence protein ComEC
MTGMNSALLAWLATLVGLALPPFLSFCPDWRLTLAAGAFLLLVCRWPVRGRGLLMLAAALLLGLGYASARADWRLRQALPPAWEGKPLVLTGVVRGLPDQRDWGNRFALEVEAVHTPSARVPGGILLSDSSRQAWPPGSRWRVTVLLKRPHGLLNPGGFDTEAWSWSNGVLAVGNVRKGRAAQGDVHDVSSLIDRLRAATVTRWQRVLGQMPEAALCAALTVGAGQALPPEVWTQLSRTGLTHLISVSGLHITLLAALVAKLAGMLARRRPSARWPPRVLGPVVGLSAAIAYSLLAGFSVPTQRSLYMLGVVVLALLSRRRYSVLQIWMAALTLVLLLDPFAVLAPGFWLSFGLVALLLMSGSGRRERPEKWAETLQGQWAATIGSVVPLAGFFGALPLISPVANAVAIPFVSALLTPVALGALLLPFDFGLKLAGWLAHWGLAGLVMLAKAPPFTLPMLPWPLVLLGLLGTLWALMPRGVPGRPFGLFLLVPVLLYTPPRPLSGAYRVTMIDIGQGLAVLVETASHTLLFDTGAGEAGRTLVPMLQARTISRLDTLVLSHNDNDHMGAAASLLAQWPVDAIRLSQPESVEEPFQHKVALCRAGEGWSWDGVLFTWLAPFGDEAEDEGNNSKSCVLRVAAGNGHGAAVLLTGDLPASGEARLLASYPPDMLRSDVLLAPHHGSNTSSSAPFIAAVAPRAAWISAGYRNQYRHPHPQVLARYQAAGVPIWRSDRDGAVTACSSTLAQGLAQGAAPARYWRTARDTAAMPSPAPTADWFTACR